MLAGYSFMDYELIESVFLASPAASVTFSNLNQYSTEYKHLQIRMISRLDTSNTARDQLMTFNGVGGTSYSGHRLLGNGSSLSANNRPSSSSMFIGLVDGNQFTAGIIDILDVYEDKNKTVRSFEGADGFAREVMLCSGLFMSTQAITSTTLFPGLNNYGIGSRFSLYGIR
jgi:hypothetical protein